MKGGNQTADTGVPGGGGDSDSELEMHQPFGQFVTRDWCFLASSRLQMAISSFLTAAKRQARLCCTSKGARRVNRRPSRLERSFKEHARRGLQDLNGKSCSILSAPVDSLRTVRRAGASRAGLLSCPLSAVVGYPPSRRPLFIFRVVAGFDGDARFSVRHLLRHQRPSPRANSGRLIASGLTTTLVLCRYSLRCKPPYQCHQPTCIASSTCV